MEKLGLAEPFLGPLLEEFCFYNGAIIVVTPALGPLLVTEFVATLEAGLPARVDDDALWGGGCCRIRWNGL